MDTKIIKTIDWSECETFLKALAQKNLGHPKEKINNFADFIHSHPDINLQKWITFLQNIVARKTFNDVTNIATISEDSCLFSYQYDTATDIILRALRTLNTGGRLPALWCFLDEEKRAVVHFVQRKGWYAEAFFACNEEFSVMHLIEANNGLTFMPVVFTKDITVQSALVRDAGNIILHSYLPRELYSFLSNKSGKKCEKHSSSLKKRMCLSRNHTDDGDML